VSGACCTSREHTESDLHYYLTWCAEHGLDPLAAQRPHLELYIRWMVGLTLSAITAYILPPFRSEIRSNICWN
jgi:hypothetical protein